MYGPTTKWEMSALLARTWFLQHRTQVIFWNAVLYIVGFGLVALVVVPR